ncbi:MAG TPA: PAS domain S-box protein [Burkholderiales bacterium]|jgi:PAS domain S-box-containing protein|nr:PAS domain S-box protein [Burkholderiales bacterium]
MPTRHSSLVRKPPRTSAPGPVPAPGDEPATADRIPDPGIGNDWHGTGPATARRPRGVFNEHRGDDATTEARFWHGFVSDFLPQMVWTAGSDGSVDFCNRYWTEYSGLLREDSRGNGWMKALHPDDLERTRRWWDVAASGGPCHDVRYRLLRAADGDYRWHLGRATAVRDRAGAVLKWIVTAIDIHEQVLGEERLQASEARYRNLVDLSRYAIYIRTEGRFVSANAATARLFGVASVDELIGQPVLPFIHPDYLDVVQERMHKTDEEHCELPPLELKLVRRDGSVIEIESIASPCEYQGRSSSYVVIRDITEREALERRQAKLLQELSAYANAAAAAEHFRLLAEAVPSMVWTARADGYLDYVNRPTLDYLGCAFTDIEGWSWDKVMHPEDLPACRARWLHSLATGEGYEMSVRILRGSDSAYRWHLVRALPVRDAAGAIMLWVGAGTDIDEQKRLETLLQESRAQLEAAVELRTQDLVSVNNALLNEIAERKQTEKALRASQEKLRKLSTHLQSARESERAAVAREIHDELGATLTAVKMDLHWYAKTLANGKPLSNDKLTDTGVLVDSAIQTVKRIATELRPSILDHLGLWPAIEWQVQELQKHYRIRCELNFESPPVNLEPEAQTALFRIVQEALTNVVRHARATQIRVRVRRSGDEVVLDIHDNGVGLPPAKLLDAGSSGIHGMRERARTFHGDVQFLTDQDSGTCVRARFPLKEKTCKQAANAREPV